MCPRTPRLPICCLMIAGIALATPAQAQPTNNDYAVDLFQGPILAPTRVTAMGGAYAGYAEGIGGLRSQRRVPSPARAME